MQQLGVTNTETMSSFIPLAEEFELLEELIKILSPFDEATQFLNANDDNLTLTFSHPCKKSKMSTFFTHLRTENSNDESNEFDRYCELQEVSLDEGSCPLEWW
ncbi:8354_t:CDS:2, partial [Racocetra fulgida]